MRVAGVFIFFHGHYTATTPWPTRARHSGVLKPQAMAVSDALIQRANSSIVPFSFNPVRILRWSLLGLFLAPMGPFPQATTPNKLPLENSRLRQICPCAVEELPGGRNGSRTGFSGRRHVRSTGLCRSICRRIGGFRCLARRRPRSAI